MNDSLCGMIVVEREEKCLTIDRTNLDAVGIPGAIKVFDQVWVLLAGDHPKMLLYYTPVECCPIGLVFGRGVDGSYRTMH